MTAWSALSTARTQAFDLLTQAIGHPDHPLHTLVLATQGPQWPEARVLILREVAPDLRRLTTFSDYRAPKIAQLHLQPKVCWLGWHPVARVQLRLYGTATLHHQDARARQAWQDLAPASRLNYSARLPAGTPIDQADATTYAAYGQHDAPESAAWAAHFAVIDTTLHHLDLVQLHQAGHRRATFTWTGQQWQGAWCVP